MREHWKGPVATYPHSGVFHPPVWEFGHLSPDELADAGRRWIAAGVGAVGGCCGTGADASGGCATRWPDALRPPSDVGFRARDRAARASTRTEVHRVADPATTRVASYLAEPDEVGRVLLLYSGGLDTSVMLKWIQDEYEAEVVALTVNLGQPGEDYEVVRGKALRLGALDCHVVDAREEFAAEYVVAARSRPTPTTATAIRCSPRSAAR